MTLGVKTDAKFGLTGPDYPPAILLPISSSSNLPLSKSDSYHHKEIGGNWTEWNCRHPLLIARRFMEHPTIRQARYSDVQTELEGDKKLIFLKKK